MPNIFLSSPTIIEPAEHRITLDMIDNDALYVLRKLNKAGFAGYLVGGGVRDLYLGKTPKDFDIGTDARPGQIRRLFPNSRTIGRRFRLVQVFFRSGKIVEVSTLRSLSEHDLDGPEAVLAPNNTYGTVGDDAQRRDITINALFFEINGQTIIDHVGGFSDLQNGIIRIIGDPDKRINRDPVRMMRVIRHASRNRFAIETRSWQAVCANSHKILLCPAARLRDELLKDISGGSAASWFQLCYRSGLFARLFPVYRAIGESTDQQKQLSAIFSTIDRINERTREHGAQRYPDHLLLAFILLPWARASWNLFDATMKGTRLHQLNETIHGTLHATVGPTLSLTRSCRQDICTMLAHLPSIHHHGQERTWPKWLKRKSYFHPCRLLYLCYLEATENKVIPDNLLVFEKTAAGRQPDTPPVHRKPSRRKGRPALDTNRPGGIFGFKR